MNRKQKWIKWLKQDLLPEVSYLLKLKTIYKTMGDIFENTKKYPKNNWFYWYAAQAHTAAVVAGIYRLIDARPKNDVISLYKLLNEVKDNPQLVSRRSYTRLPRNSYRDRFDYRIEKRRLNNEFTDRAGNGDCIEHLKVRQDIQHIKEISKKIEKFRHKFIGHHAYNQRQCKLKPTFKEAHDCIDQLNDIFKKYYLLITGDSIITNEMNDVRNDLVLFFKDLMKKSQINIDS